MKRKPKTITIETHAGRRRVQCFRRYKHFAITARAMNRGEKPPRNFYNVTHVASGSLVGEGYRTLRRAELFAAVMDCLPFPWPKVSKYNVIRKRDRERFFKMWHSMPVEVQRWRFLYELEFGQNPFGRKKIA